MTRPSPSQSLPAFIQPMLASSGTAFDDDTYLFEIKWNGMRMLAFLETPGYRLLNRHGIDTTSRYPEFAFLAGLPPGTLLDGEMVVFRDGQPDLPLLQGRDKTRSALKTRTLSQAQPATYLAFDLLYEKFVPLLDRPLAERRRRLECLLRSWSHPRLVLSQGIVGQGRMLFAETCRQNLEGIMAKRLASPYRPGKRGSDWIKIKRRLEMLCVIIGFTPRGTRDFANLILAAEDQGQLRAAGKVKNGLRPEVRARLNAWLWTHGQERPVVPCRWAARWVRPELFCRVSCLELTRRGEWCFPVCEQLLWGPPE
jgi:bifunctional non-homologous end joining protein LigD